ncbi:MAG: zinc metalloprotease HtpX [Coxiella endosymbiont of Dermacentor silvarum]
MGFINNFESTIIDCRKSLRRNRRKTALVIITFMLIYLVIGLLIDFYIYTGRYPRTTVFQLFMALVTLKMFPTATFITGLIVIFSLYVTFVFHHRLILLGTDYWEITSRTAKTFREKMLYNIVEELKVAAALRFMPKVYIIDADYMNAFTSGFSEKSAMVAVTSGVLIKLNRSELKAVMAHEISHIRHIDIRLTLITSVLANILLIFVDILFFSAIFGGHSRERGARNQLFIFILILRYLLPLVTVLLMLYLSRTREYMADAGSVELMCNNEPLVRALLKIQDDHVKNREEYKAQYTRTSHESIRQAAYIYDPVKAGIELGNSLSDLFSTHPSLTKRLAAIGYKL